MSRRTCTLVQAYNEDTGEFFAVKEVLLYGSDAQIEGRLRALEKVFSCERSLYAMYRMQYV